MQQKRQNLRTPSEEEEEDEEGADDEKWTEKIGLSLMWVV